MGDDDTPRNSDGLPDNLFFSALHSTAVDRMTALITAKAPAEFRPVVDVLIPIISDGLTELIAYVVDAIQYERVEVAIADDADNTITITQGVSDDQN